MSGGGISDANRFPNFVRFKVLTPNAATSVGRTERRRRRTDKVTTGTEGAGGGRSGAPGATAGEPALGPEFQGRGEREGEIEREKGRREGRKAGDHFQTDRVVITFVDGQGKCNGPAPKLYTFELWHNSGLQRGSERAFGMRCGPLRKRLIHLAPF